ncbi:hypothetical protein ABIF99_010089 [Bradyrhizobium japonicum]|nr:hypothetical protein [Bradyrhizobium japonicum]MCP1856003.1 hypothetical protein [Bradyrhizobium japonicum]MCP1897182.1 hypothetical protein [Bradyrhizobium japonicum]MCW2330770.1 hypothetical protein [Bradyrhizobium japonicum]
MDRRHFIAGAGLAVGFAKARTAVAQPALDAEVRMLGQLPPLPDDLANNADANPAPFVETATVGTAPPSDNEISQAFEILLNSPWACDPLAVAQYFLAVGAGSYGQEYRQYVREWPVRANPLIYHFFSATRTKPEGDATAWCAAFVNWCLVRARASGRDQIGKAPGFFSQGGSDFSDNVLKAHSTNNASSGSFRCWPEKTSPQPGDLVVFRDSGTDGLTSVCRGSGHVAFFLAIPRSGVVRVLGGNQSLKGSNGAVTVAEMSTSPGGRFMKFVRAI